MPVHVLCSKVLIFDSRRLEMIVLLYINANLFLAVDVGVNV